MRFWQYIKNLKIQEQEPQDRDEKQQEEAQENNQQSSSDNPEQQESQQQNNGTSQDEKQSQQSGSDNAQNNPDAQSDQTSEEQSKVEDQSDDNSQSKEDSQDKQETSQQQGDDKSQEGQASKEQQSGKDNEQSEQRGASQEQQESSQQQGDDKSQEGQASKEQQSGKDNEQSEQSGSSQDQQEASEQQGDDKSQEGQASKEQQAGKDNEQSEQRGASQDQQRTSQQQGDDKSQEGQASKEQQSGKDNEQSEQRGASQEQQGLDSEKSDNHKQSEGEKSDLEQPLQSINEALEDQTTESNPEIRKEKLQRLRDAIQNYIDTKRKQDEQKAKLERSHLHAEETEVEESKEEEYQLDEHTNKFLEQLSELPSFHDRQRGPGYSIDTRGYTEVPDSVIRTLITKFLNQRFCKRKTDLNVRSNSLEKSRGFYKWEVKDVITHLETHQITKVLDDKYGYEYANGKNENVPLSFYFDMSGSMSEYTNMLAVIAIELLKKNVKVLIGFNERVNVQIEKITKNIDVADLAEILESAGYSYWSGQSRFIRDPRVSFKFIGENLDNYLIAKKAEKCVVFADFDPVSEVINLSHAADLYWFCFESNFDKVDLRRFSGFIYKVRNIKDIMSGLIKVNEKRFEALCYVDNPKTLQKKLGG